MSITQEWLSEYKSATTRSTVQLRFNFFMQYINSKAVKQVKTKKSGKTYKKRVPVEPFYSDTVEQLSKLTPKEVKHLLLQFQSDLAKNGVKANSILAYVSAARNFFEFCEISIKFRRGQLVNAEKAEGYHVFSNGDLRAMFQVANVQYKALIATAASTGFSLDHILHLDKKQVSALIKRANESNQTFAFFNSVRRKTNVQAFGVLNPLALEWLEKWIEQNSKDTLFNVKHFAIDTMLKKLAERSAITLTGGVRFHNIRKWVVSSLSKAGFNSFQIKRTVGKKIPLSDETYLPTLDEEIKQKYPEIYETHLSILKTAKIIIQKDPEVKELRRIIKIQQEALQKEVKARLKVENLVERQDLSLKEHAKLIESLSKQLRKLSCE